MTTYKTQMHIFLLAVVYSFATSLGTLGRSKGGDRCLDLRPCRSDSILYNANYYQGYQIAFSCDPFLSFALVCNPQGVQKCRLLLHTDTRKKRTVHKHICSCASSFAAACSSCIAEACICFTFSSA
eukprot:5591532-Amphidinium_carterae.1